MPDICRGAALLPKQLLRVLCFRPFIVRQRIVKGFCVKGLAPVKIIVFHTAVGHIVLAVIRLIASLAVKDKQVITSRLMLCRGQALCDYNQFPPPKGKNGN